MLATDNGLYFTTIDPDGSANALWLTQNGTTTQLASVGQVFTPESSSITSISGPFPGPLFRFQTKGGWVLYSYDGSWVKQTDPGSQVSSPGSFCLLADGGILISPAAGTSVGFWRIPAGTQQIETLFDAGSQPISDPNPVNWGYQMSCDPPSNSALLYYALATASDPSQGRIAAWTSAGSTLVADAGPQSPVGNTIYPTGYNGQFSVITEASALDNESGTGNQNILLLWPNPAELNYALSTNPPYKGTLPLSDGYRSYLVALPGDNIAGHNFGWVLDAAIDRRGEMVFAFDDGSGNQILALAYIPLITSTAQPQTTTVTVSGFNLCPEGTSSTIQVLINEWSAPVIDADCLGTDQLTFVDNGIQNQQLIGPGVNVNSTQGSNGYGIIHDFGPNGLGVAPPPPAIRSFSVTPMSIVAGQSVTLSWTTTGATSVSIDQGVGTVAATGTVAVSPAATTTYTLTATNAGGTSSASLTVTVTPADTPVISPGGVVNAATFDARLSPGSILAVYGQNLAGGTTAALFQQGAFVPAWTDPNGNSIQISAGGRPCPLVYVSPTQINCQLSWATAVGSPVTVQAFAGSLSSNTVSIMATATAPAPFLYQGMAILTDVNGQLVTEANPAIQGGAYTLWLQGLGATSNQPTDGVPFGLELADAQAGVSLSFSVCCSTGSGSAAKILFAGGAPGEIIDQINFVFPEVPFPNAAGLEQLLGQLSVGGQSTLLTVYVLYGQ